MRAWLLHHKNTDSYTLINEDGHSYSFGLQSLIRSLKFDREISTISNLNKLNILNIKGNHISEDDEFEFIEAWKFGDKDIRDLCKLFNSKAGLLNMKVACKVDMDLGGCNMEIWGDTYIPEKIPDWVNAITRKSPGKVLNKKVILGQTTYILGKGVFRDSNLEEILINDSLAYVDAFAFENCHKLKSITFPRHINYISRDMGFIENISLWCPVYSLCSRDYNDMRKPELFCDKVEFRTDNKHDLTYDHGESEYKHIVLNDVFKNWPKNILLKYISTSNIPEISFKTFPKIKTQ